MSTNSGGGVTEFPTLSPEIIELAKRGVYRLTREQIALYFHVHKKTISMWVEEYGMPYFSTPTNRNWSFSLPDVLEWSKRYGNSLPEDNDARLVANG